MIGKTWSIETLWLSLLFSLYFHIYLPPCVLVQYKWRSLKMKKVLALCSTSQKCYNYSIFTVMLQLSILLKFLCNYLLIPHINYQSNCEDKTVLFSSKRQWNVTARAKNYLHKMNTLPNDTVSVQIVLRLLQNKIFIVMVFNKYCVTQFNDNLCTFHILR